MFLLMLDPHMATHVSERFAETDRFKVLKGDFVKCRIHSHMCCRCWHVQSHRSHPRDLPRFKFSFLLIYFYILNVFVDGLFVEMDEIRCWIKLYLPQHKKKKRKIDPWRLQFVENPSPPTMSSTPNRILSIFLNSFPLF